MFWSDSAIFVCGYLRPRYECSKIVICMWWVLACVCVLLCKDRSVHLYLDLWWPQSIKNGLEFRHSCVSVCFILYCWKLEAFSAILVYFYWMGLLLQFGPVFFDHFCLLERFLCLPIFFPDNKRRICFTLSILCIELLLQLLIWRGHSMAF